MMGKNLQLFSVSLMFLIALLVVCPAGNCASENPITIYVTTADYHWLLDWPMDSEESITAAIDSIKHTFHADRVFWRGGLVDLWLRDFHRRPENRLSYGWWDWIEYLNDDLKMNPIAIKAAKDRGMDIYLFAALFEYGSPADSPGLGYPFPIESNWRIEHPEWAPANKYGTRVQGGPIEFCFPEARKSMVRVFTNQMVRDNYDGIMFYTYVENNTSRYLDEFGYSKPIVDEFKKRYGVDIRTQPFDKEAWSKLRGEYLTQFFRELHASFAPQGKKISVAINPKDSHLPVTWGPNGPITAGRIYMDWETWAKEGIVDELMVAYPSVEESEKTLKHVLEVCKGTNTKVSQWKSRGDIAVPGISRVVFPGGEESMSGFFWESNILWKGEQIVGQSIYENLPEQPMEALRNGDVYAKRRCLYMIFREKQTAPIGDVIAAARDKDIYVRVMALRALAKMKNQAAIPTIEAALLDPENGVRCQAVVSLGELSGPNSVSKILDAVWRKNSTWQFNFVAIPEAVTKLNSQGRVTPENLTVLVSRLTTPDVKNRRSALNILSICGAKDAAVQAAAIKVIKEDPDSYCRELAIKVLANGGPNPASIKALEDALKDPYHATQVRAARGLTSLARASGEAVRTASLRSIESLFREYGDGCSRTDSDWGWRDLGNCLLMFGKDGESVLQDMMSQREDHQLADRAWRVLYIRQQESGHVTITEEEDAKAHAVRPKW